MIQEFISEFPVNHFVPNLCHVYFSELRYLLNHSLKDRKINQQAKIINEKHLK